MKFPKEKGKIANPSASSSRLLAQQLRVLPQNGGFYDASEEKLTPHLTTWWVKTYERDRSGRFRTAQGAESVIPQNGQPSERQTGLPRIPGGPANDSRLRSGSHDPEGAGSMGGRRQPSSPDSVHRPPFRFGNLRTNDRR